MIKLRKKLLCLAAIVFAVFTALGVWTIVAPEKTADAYGADAQEVQLKDLMDRHGVNYAIGPLAPSGTTYYDKNGDATNNVYGIERDRYFDYTNYLRIPSGTTTLYGWNNNIAPGNTVGTINTDGKISGHDNQIYIYENAKYVIVVPDFITTFGTGVYHHKMTDGNGNTHENITLNATDTYNYTSFSTYHYYETGSPASWDWQPRERLAGIYCGPNSQLTTINGISGVSLETTGNLTGAPANRPETESAGAKTSRPMLYYCDNMRFCILPNGLQTIGNLAFGHCQQLRDVNIPVNKVTVGNFAFSYCSVMPHITIPSGTTLGTNVFYNCNNLRDIEDNTNYALSNFPARMNRYTSSSGKSQLFAIGTKDGDTGTQAFYYCYNSVLGNSTALATKNGSTQMAGYATGWYVIGLAGLEDKDKQTLYEMPATVSGDSDVRRADIKYDYINPDRTIHKNKFSGNTNTNNQKITEYNIAKNAISETWCGNVIIPKTVTTIGDNAFYYTHMQYLEIGSGVKYIGYQAFNHNASNMDVKGSTVFNRRQYYYIHNNTAQENIGNNAFEAVVNNANRSGAATERWYIFDESTWGTRDYYTNSSMSSVQKKKQVPVYAEVESNDGRVEIIGDMETRFRHDSDVVLGSYKQYSADGTTYQQVTNTTNGNGTYKITYTKRLEGHPHDFVKDSRGLWINANDGIATGTASNNLPTIVGYKTTNWYANKAGTDNKLANLGPVYPTTVGAAKSIYSQKIAKPTDITPNDWTYSEDMNEIDNSFNKLLNLSDDFIVRLSSYLDPWSETNASRPYVNAAGTYNVSIQLNPTKWGEWTDDEPLTATAYVDQKEIDLGKFENVPKFWARGASQNALSGNNTPIYEYSDGYYITKRTGLIEISTETVSNSYAMYTGQELQIGPETNWTLYDVNGDSTSRLVATASGRYDASFNFVVKNSNYKFVYDGLDDSTQVELFTDNRMSYTITGERSASINKRWFIVTPFNWLVDVSSAGGAASINNQFVLAEKSNGDGTYSAIYDWTYDYNDITIRVNTPKLANGHVDGILSASVLRNGTLIKDDIDVKDLAYYINNSMPAGEYTVIISAKEAGSYGAFDTVFTINVSPKQLDASAIINYLTNNNAETGNIFEKAYDDTLFLYEQGDAWNTIVSTVNASLNTNRENSSNNYWTQQAQDGYYGKILLKYNLDALQTTTYYDTTDLAMFSAAPKNVGQYLVYYSVSAPNYITVGETDKPGDARRDYRFTSVIYDLLSAADLADKINDGNYVYTGSPVYATVPYSINYNYSFDDTTANAYITVDRYHYVTVTINDPLLMRWKETDSADVTVDENNDNTSQIITIRYLIAAADNQWQSNPQMTAWSYKGFNTSTHRITGTLTYQGAQVYYRLGRLVESEYVWIDAGNTVEGLTGKYFTVNANGEVTDEDVIGILNTLPADTYYLDSYVMARADGNVKAFNTPTTSYSTVYISQAVNLWTSSPNVIRWTWGEYDETVNLFSATAQFGAADLSATEIENGIEAPEVTYTILKFANGSFEPAADALVNFTSVDPDVAAALMALDAGTYYLVATLDERDNFRAINSAAIDYGEGVNYNAADKVQFEIRIAQNSWATSPRMTTWQYKQFTDSANFIAGIPTYGVLTDVTYSIYTSEDNLNKGTAGINFTVQQVTDEDGTITIKLVGADGKDVVTYLSTLSAGTDYWLVASVDGATNKYNALSREINFAIIPATNSWSQTPAITGWTYLSFNNGLVTEGTAVYGDVVYIVQKYNATGGLDDITEALDFDNLLKALKDLEVNASGYNLKVTTVEADDYYQASEQNKYFSISKADDEWKSEKEPSITDTWVFGTSEDKISINNGELVYQNDADKTVEYYYTATDRNGQLIVNYIKPATDGDVLPTAVGSYARVTTVAESDNFNELVHVSFFTITKVPNEWKTSPEMSLDWTWGDNGNAYANSNLIKAEAKYPATITYSIYKGEDEYLLNISKDDILGVLKKLPAGQYSVRTIVAATEDGNYDVPVPGYLATTVNVAKADFVVTTAPSSTVWTWGAASTPFTAMVVQAVKAAKENEPELVNDNALIEYKIGNGSWKSYSDMLEDLQGSAADTYTVQVRVTYPNYNDNTSYSVTVEIRKVAFTWTGDGTTKFGWFWNNSTDATGKTLPTLTASTTAKDIGDATVTYVVSQGENTTTSLTHSSLLEYLYNINRIGEYTVTATASTGSASYDTNFTDASKTRTFTVNIAQAENGWSTTPTTSLVFNYEEGKDWVKLSDITIGVPNYGTVKYSDNNGSPITEADIAAKLVEIINGLSARGTAYEFNIAVDEDPNGRYEGFTAKLSVKLNGIASEWKNTADIKDHEFTYDGDLSTNMDTVAIPELERELSGSLYYTIKYVDIGGTESSTTFIKGTDGVTFEDIISRVKAYLMDSTRGAGTYTVTAVYNPDTTNYAELNTAFTINVKILTIDWSTATKALESEYIFELGNAPAITPVTNSGDAGITVPVKYIINGTEPEPAITDLQAYLNSQPMGTYNVRYSVTETNNYNGLAERSMRVVITKAANRWETIDNRAVWEFKRGETINITVPKALHGINTYKIGDGQEITQEGFDLNAELYGRNLPAGNYTITIRVIETPAYYGTETYTFTLSILKKDNSWTKAPVDTITKVGKLQVSDFTIPQAKVDNSKSLLRFDIAKAGGGATYGLDTTAFKKAIPGLTDGTYTITMRVGGTGTGYDEDATALATYNADYNPLIATTVLTVTRAQLIFSTHLAVPDWSYDNRFTAKDNVTKPVYGVSGTLTDEEKANITEGVQVVYSITGNVSITEPTTGLTYDQFLLKLDKLNPGTYSVTASIATTETYIGVSETIAFNVTKINTVWVSEGTLTNLLTWTHGSTVNALVLGTPKLAGSDTRSVTYTLRSGTSTTDSLSGYWHEKLRTLGAGTYVFTASVEENATHTSAEYQTTVTVNRATRVWNAHPSQTLINWTYHDTVNNNKDENKVVYRYTVPVDDEKDIDGNYIAMLQIYIDNVLFSGEDLATKLNSLTYGNHTITATVAQTAYYGSLTETITLSIARAENDWHTVTGDKYAMKLNESWAWDNVANADNLKHLGWQVPIPENGTTVNITVERYELDSDGNKTGVKTTVYGTTFTYANHVLVGDDSGLKNTLRLLGAGKYKITALVPQDDCYDELSRNIDFEVTKADNEWLQTPLAGTNSNGIVTITSTPKYGSYADVVYEYALEGSDEWSTQVPTVKGSYKFRATLAGTDNYNILNYPGGTFHIEQENNGWVVLPGVSNWEWNAFNRTENVFRGTALNNGTVTFKITTPGGNDLTTNDFIIDGSSEKFSPAQIETINAGFSRGSDGLISEDIATMLKALMPRNNYRLIVTASGDDNYGIFSSETQFTVTKATNEWTEGGYPNVDSFVYKGTVSFTAGVTKYGTNNVSYKVIDAYDGSIAISESAFKAAADKKALIKGLDVGSYVLQVWVPEGNTYKELYKEDAPYTKPFSVTVAVNGWETTATPSISEYWSDLQGIGDIDDLFAAPTAKQGTPVYQLYYTNYSPVGDEDTYYKRTELLAAIKELDSGDYVLRITLDGDTLKNYGNLTADVSLSIMRYTTDFVNADGLKGVWHQDANDATKNATVLSSPDVAITAKYGVPDTNGNVPDVNVVDTLDNSFVVYTFGSKNYTWTELMNSDAVKELNAGSYQVTVSIPATNVYAAVSKTIQLDVAQGTNEWTDNLAAADRLKLASTGALAGNSWKYGTAIEWKRAVPKYGTTVYVEIRVAGASEALSYITIDSNAANGVAGAIASVGSDLSKLNAGTYVITVSAPAAQNWAALTSSATFTVKQADNAWVTGPKMQHSVNNEWVDGNTWIYGSAARPLAEAQHGTVIYKYYKKGSTTELGGLPVDAGDYTVEFIVENTTNYKPLKDSIEFTILRADVTSFIVSSGTTGWTWNEYNRNTNLFTGIPTTLGAVSYTVLYKNQIVVIDGIELKNIELVDANGNHTGDPDKDLYVPDVAPYYYASKLNKLTANNADDLTDRYTLRINVGEVGNYNGFSSDSTFAVSTAVNGWVTTPRITPWALGSFNGTTNAPSAVSLYGAPSITIISSLNGDVYYVKEKGSVIKDILEYAPAGWYVMEVSVEGVSGKYSGLELDEPIKFQVFVIDSTEKNSWVTDPDITGWTATTDIDKINMPIGTPLRGLPYFKFFDATTGKEITAADDVFVVDKGNAYFQDFYIPKADGRYYMMAYACRYDLSGENIIDEIDAGPVWFTIEKRDNGWDTEPRIPNVLYLGEKASWTDPVSNASTLEGGSVITAEYFDKETGRKISDEIPTVAGIPAVVGQYKVIVTATTKYCKTIYYEADFRVEYSYNAWKSAPTIEGWSAEYEGNIPVAEAVYGTDKIVYTYAKIVYNPADPDNPQIIPWDGKPTEEGDYIMYANIYCENEGYANINAEFRFTVTPAFDTDLLIVDIVLGSVGCVLTIVVMGLGIRKRRYL